MLADRLKAVLDELATEMAKRGIDEPLYMTKYSFLDEFEFHFGGESIIAGINIPVKTLNLVKLIMDQPIINGDN